MFSYGHEPAVSVSNSVEFRRHSRGENRPVGPIGRSNDGAHVAARGPHTLPVGQRMQVISLRKRMPSGPFIKRSEALHVDAEGSAGSHPSYVACHQRILAALGRSNVRQEQAARPAHGYYLTLSEQIDAWPRS